MTRRFGIGERCARMGVRHHLASSGTDLVQVAGDVAGLHSSDPATVYLSLRARVAGFSTESLETALYEDRTLLRLLGMRRTMFVVPPDLAAEMQWACAVDLAPPQRRRLIGWLTDQGVGDEAWMDGVAERTLAALADRGEATAIELREIVPELQIQLDAGKYGTFGLSTRILFQLAVEGRILRTRPLGTWVSTQYRWALLDSWLEGGLSDLDPEAAAAHLVRRWLRAYGPGTERDVSWWTGWGVRKTRAALAAVGAVDVDLDGSTGYVLPDDLDPAPDPAPWVAFLPGLDPATMGWKERDWYLGGHHPELFDRNGNGGPTVWADGRIIGGWTQRPEGEVAYELLEDVGSESREAVEAEAGRLEAWLGERRFKTRFPTPLEKRLLG